MVVLPSYVHGGYDLYGHVSHDVSILRMYTIVMLRMYTVVSMQATVYTHGYHDGYVHDESKST